MDIIFDKTIPLYIRQYSSKDPFSWKIIFIEQRDDINFISNYNEFLDECRNSLTSYNDNIIYEINNFRNSSDGIGWKYLTINIGLGIIEKVDDDVIRTMKEL